MDLPLWGGHNEVEYYTLGLQLPKQWVLGSIFPIVTKAKNLLFR